MATTSSNGNESSAQVVMLDDEHRLLDRAPDCIVTTGNTPFFWEIINEVQLAINAGMQPTLVVQGSSGSYFCRNRAGKIVGIFKPKEEEPYGDFNPKCGKWVQRTLCRCCFGRSCLLLNTGYLSEAAASVVARELQMDIVPETGLVKLASPAFNYSYLKRRMHTQDDLPAKIGSFQVFVNGYDSATNLLPRMNTMTAKEAVAFQRQFEYLVILDYVIRNTDRGNDNWLVKWKPRQTKRGVGRSSPALGAPASSGSIDAEDDEQEVLIAGIDNGLAFPFKHPDNWRTYPFGWADLPYSRQPFSKETIQQILPLLEDQLWRQRLVDSLQQIMAVDKRYREYVFTQQVAVLRGQMYNLAEVLCAGGSPADLLARPPVVVESHPQRGFVARILRSRPCFGSC